MNKSKTSYHFQLFFTITITLLNIGTLYFTAPLSQNLSDLGNALGHRNYLILWGSSAALYFCVYTLKLMQQSSYPSYLGKALLIIACLGMICSVLLPYYPQQVPELSKWHTRLAIGSTGLYVVVVYHYLFDLMKKDFCLFQHRLAYFSTLVTFDLLLYLFHGGVSTLLEITFTIGMVILLLEMCHKK